MIENVSPAGFQTCTYCGHSWTYMDTEDRTVCTTCRKILSTPPMPKNLKRVSMETSDAQWLLEVIQTHITNRVISGLATPEEFRPYQEVIKRIKHVAET